MRSLKFLIILVRVIVIFFIGFYSANISSRLIEDRLEGLSISTPQAVSMTGPAKTTPLNAQRKSIMQRNIFDSTYSEAKAEPVPAAIFTKPPLPSADDGHDKGLSSLEAEKKNAPPTRLRVKLMGTIVGEEKIFSAIIQNPRKRGQSIFQINDTIQDNVKIADIERNKVYIIRDGKMELLEIYPKKQKPGQQRLPGSPRRTVPKIANTAPPKGDMEMILDKAEVEAAMLNIPQLLTKARIVPHFSGGKTEGFKIFSIVPGSLFDKVGLRNGDVLVQINGIEIKDPQNFLNIFQQLKDESSISLDLVRKGARQTMSYDIR